MPRYGGNGYMEQQERRNLLLDNEMLLTSCQDVQWRESKRDKGNYKQLERDEIINEINGTRLLSDSASRAARENAEVIYKDIMFIVERIMLLKTSNFYTTMHSPNNK
jgi:hypothetical protein